MSRTRPPFRADHVGSLLRPHRLKQARERFLGPQTPDQNLGPHDNAELRAVEDECIRDVIALQERAGLRLATDGEFRRRSWWLELVMNWQGLAANRTGTTDLSWRNEGGVQQAFSRLWIEQPIRWRPSPIVRAFEFLAANTRLAPKVTIPAPILMHMFALGDKGVLETCYQSVDAFWHDVVEAYRQEMRALIDAGARYIQLDDTSIAFLCDPQYRETVRKWGNDPDELLVTYAERINEVLEVVPDDVSVTLHQCRGNREGYWAAEGGYDPVADVMFNRINVDGYFLEFDSARAGTFEPLRLLPRGHKVVAIGIVSSKSPAMETKDALKRRIEDAARYAPLEQLALAPQCGFASSIVGNPLTEADEEGKLRLITEVANEVWPDA